MDIDYFLLAHRNTVFCEIFSVVCKDFLKPAESNPATGVVINSTATNKDVQEILKIMNVRFVKRRARFYDRRNLDGKFSKELIKYIGGKKSKTDSGVQINQILKMTKKTRKNKVNSILQLLLSLLNRNDRLSENDRISTESAMRIFSKSYIKQFLT